jgi:predicted outer membrane repeat protein
MKRAIAFAITLTFVAGCSGMGSNSNGMLPGTSGYNAARAGLSSDHHRRSIPVRVTMRIPKRRRGAHAALHPATISPLTQSVSIAVNGGAPSIFNTTTSSPNCSAGASGTTCTFAVIAPIGNDTFAVTTYNAVSGGGTPLNSGSAVVAIVAGKANAPHITLGPVVSTTADTGIGSLRYAIGSANPGDTIMFMLASGSTIAVGSSLTLNTSVSIAGPGVTTSIRMHRGGHHGNITFSGITIDGGGTQQIFVVKAGVTASISGLILANGYAGTAHQPGGAVNNAGSLSLSDDAVTGATSVVTSMRRAPAHMHLDRPRHRHAGQRLSQTLRPHCVAADQYAGGVYNDGVMTITGTTFDSNVLHVVSTCSNSYGGAVYNDEYGTMTVSGSTFSNNSAEYGGAIYNYSGYGSLSVDSSAFTGNYGCTAATGCATAGCTGNGCAFYPQGYGGAIYDDWGPGVTITNSTFSSNVTGGVDVNSLGEGGAINLETGSPSITGSTFTGNQAGGGTANCSEGYGGAIYEDASNTLELDNDTFTNNTASGDYQGYGGAVYNDNDPDNGSNDTFTGNSASAPGSACSSFSYQSSAEGGALYADYGANLSSSTFTNNSLTASYSTVGGAIYVDDPSILSNDTFTGNSATTSGANSAPDSYAEAGAIDNDDSLRLTNSTITGNTVSAASTGTLTSYVYAAAVSNDGSLVSSGNTISSNTATQSGSSSGSNGIYGGVIYDNTWSSNHDTISSNTATAAGVIYGGVVYANSALGITNATISNNSATSSAKSVYGGGLYLYVSSSSDHSSLTNSTISGNSATGATGQGGYGGGIYDDAYSNFGGLQITNNTATTGGGGIYTDTTDTFANSAVSGNSVTAAAQYYGGGGIYSDGPTTITNSTFSSNSVTVAASDAGGGGVYNDYQTSMSGSTITGNSVAGSGAGSGGGGMFNYDNGTFTNDTFTANTSALDGGGYDSYNNAYNPLFINVTFYKNTATGLGGNIRNGYTMEMGNTIAAGGVPNDVDNTGGTLTSDDYNLIQAAVVGNPLAGMVSNNKLGVDPALLPLSNNGGPTFTLADQAASPGKAAIPWTSTSGGTCGNETGVMVDQRNFTRGAGGFCDIGAFEFGGTPSLVRVHAHAVRGHSRKHHARHLAPPKPR